MPSRSSLSTVTSWDCSSGASPQAARARSSTAARCRAFMSQAVAMFGPGAGASIAALSTHSPTTGTGVTRARGQTFKQLSLLQERLMRTGGFSIIAAALAAAGCATTPPPTEQLGAARASVAQAEPAAAQAAPAQLTAAQSKLARAEEAMKRGDYVAARIYA